MVHGSIVGLALVVALEWHPPGSGTVAGALLGTAVTLGLAEAYSEFVATEARERRRVRRAEAHRLGRAAAAVAFGAGFPAIFFAIAAAGALERDTAFALARWSGLGLICAYGYVAARLAGNRIPRALAHSAVLGLVAGVLIAVKAAFH